MTRKDMRGGASGVSSESARSGACRLYKATVQRRVQFSEVQRREKFSEKSESAQEV
jgi:hypothetical protein